VPEEIHRGQLEKLVIQAFKDADYSGNPLDTFEVPLNPEEYTWNYDVEYNEAQGDGTTGSPGVYRKIKPQQYTLKFLLDGTGVTGKKIDVVQKIDDFFKIVGYTGEEHRPYYLKLIWGKLESRCVLIKADVTYKLFYPDGRPLRATINATFTETIDDKTRVKKARDSSPDLTHIRVVKQGDALPLLAYDIYGDPSYYLEVARVNKLNHFAQLRPGEKLIFPPIEKVINRG
jgi:hypothetical protein